MGDELQKVIHFNPRLQHQVDHAEAFRACGFGVTSSPHDVADIHVISGPHYAYNQWRNHPRTLMIDRAWWGDPDCVSIGWLNKDGSRRFATGAAERPKPAPEDWKPQWTRMGEISCLILADYNQDVDWIVSLASKRFPSVTVREHPANRKYMYPLDDAIRSVDCVVGTSGTAVFMAIQSGIPAICLDAGNACAPVCVSTFDVPLYRGDRSQWLHEMSYKQWSLDEIRSGAAWEALQNV